MADDSGEIVREAAESVAFENVKTNGGASAFYTQLAFANAVSNQQALNQIQQAIVGKVSEAIISTDPREGGVDVAALQVLSKIAGNTPPVTP